MECEGGGRNTTHRRGKRSSLCTVILIIFLSTVMCQISSANNITYTYVGNPFTLFAGIDQCPPQCNVSGWFTISDAPLHPYPGFSSPVAIIHNDITFSFTDGLNTITQDNASNVDFELAIGSSGHFDFTTGWCIYVGMGIAHGTPLLNIDTISNGLGCAGTNDQTYLFGTLPFFSLQVLGDAIVTEDPGTWSATTVPSPVPEPRSMLLLGTGAMILLVVVRRKSETFAKRTTGSARPRSGALAALLPRAAALPVH
jgi:hypothetical protein